MVPNLSRPKDISYKDDIRTEAFRQMRTDLLALEPDSKVIAITSANEGEGKSTIVANLALSLARLNRKVLLIDFDLRSPTQDKLFGLPNDVGISTVLMNKSQVSAAIQSTKSPFLKVITSGPVTPHSTELLFMTSARSAKLLEALQREYDYILLDTPPLLPVADTAIIAQLVDSVIQVVRSGHSGELAALAAQQRISQLQARQVGIVLNNVAPNGKLYHYDVIPAKANS
jgi:non-specific protein-tyrosine kinase